MRFWKISLSLLFFASLTFADPVLVPDQPMTFNGGLNLETIIADGDSPDTNNFINEPVGSIGKRNGSRRFNVQAVSTNPITSLFRAYVSSNTSFLRTLLFTTKDRIYYTTSSMDLPNPFMVTIASFVYPNDTWRWLMMNNQAMAFGDSLQDDIKTFNVKTSSLTNLMNQFTTTDSIRIRGRYPLQSRNYLMVANCALVTTYTVTVSTYFPVGL